MNLSSADRDDLIEAANALSLTTASLEKRIARLDEELRALKTERKAGIDTLVAQLLPNLRRSTFDALVAAAPRFVDAEVHYLMHRRWYTLFFFKRKGYDQTLTTLCTRMAFAAGKGLLPQIEDRVADWNKSIDTLQAERAELAVRQRDVLVSLDLLRAAAGNTIRLPEQARKDVKIIVQKARAARSAAQASQGGAQGYNRSPYENATYQSHVIDSRDAQVVYVDNVDTWSNFANEVPQSLSIVAFEAMRQSHQANPMNDSGSIASGGNNSDNDSGIDFADPPTRASAMSAASDIDFGDAPSSRASASGGDIDFGDDPESRAGATIATDDRLGAFS
jgi:hypothetical protein